jgi:hypothetical protein
MLTQPWQLLVDRLALERGSALLRQVKLLDQIQITLPHTRTRSSVHVSLGLVDSEEDQRERQIQVSSDAV